MGEGRGVVAVSAGAIIKVLGGAYLSLAIFWAKKSFLPLALGGGTYEWVPQGSRAGNIHCTTPWLPRGALWWEWVHTCPPLAAKQATEADLAHLWRPVSAWLSAEGPLAALLQWSQCGYCHLRLYVFCPAGGWGCLVYLQLSALWVARLWVACPQSTSPQTGLCPPGVQRGHVCFQHYIHLREKGGQ